MSYDPERKYDVHLLAGLTGTMRMAPSAPSADPDMNSSRFFMGFETGMQASWLVVPKVRVFLEPKLRLYGKKLLKQSAIQNGDMVMSLQAGATYSF